jgi:hypothetical protein
MDRRNMDARDLASEAEAVFEQLEVAPPAALGAALPAPPSLAISMTREELVALIQDTVYQVIATSENIRALVGKVPRGED